MKILTWLILVELGIIPHSGFIIYDPPERVFKETSFYIDMDAELGIGPFFVGGGLKTYFWKVKDGIRFSPHLAEYRCRAGIKIEIIKELELTAGGRTACFHPVIPYLYQENIQPKWEGAYSELFVRFKAELK